ncbi:MAG: DUF1002 domain-containing protein [Lachnospiraceae bacterium]|nr:DUF1002 domain-containing protein [Lachnospiraceae bacterium]
MKMKKLIILALSAALVLPLVACGGEPEDLYELDMGALGGSGELPGNLDAKTAEALAKGAGVEDGKLPADWSMIESGLNENAEDKEQPEDEQEPPEEQESEEKDAPDEELNPKPENKQENKADDNSGGKPENEQEKEPEQEAGELTAEKEPEQETGKVSAKKEPGRETGKAPAENEPEREAGKAPAEKEPERETGEQPAPKEPEGMYVALGKDLDDEQLAIVLDLLGITREELDGMDVAYVTNEEEHAFLDSYIDAWLIGKNALSSVLVKPREKGHGVEVETKNIIYCSPDMYKNAFMTAGVRDADITVAGPFELSGTAALIGAVKAYEKMSGKTISDKVVDAAMDELITTGNIAEAVGSKNKAVELISYIKAKVLAEKPGTREEVEALVRQALEELGISLRDKYIQRIVDLILKIAMSGIDLDALAALASGALN